MPYVQQMKLLNSLQIIKLCFLLELFAQIYNSVLICMIWIVQLKNQYIFEKNVFS